MIWLLSFLLALPAMAQQSTEVRNPRGEALRVEGITGGAAVLVDISTSTTISSQKSYTKISSSFTVTSGTGFFNFSSTGTITHVSIAAPNTSTVYNWFLTDTDFPQFKLAASRLNLRGSGTIRFRQAIVGSLKLTVENSTVDGDFGFYTTIEK